MHNLLPEYRRSRKADAVCEANKKSLLQNNNGLWGKGVLMLGTMAGVTHILLDIQPAGLVQTRQVPPGYLSHLEGNPSKDIELISITI